MYYWHFPANFTIPSIYDETLSYEVQLGKVLTCLRQMKECVEELSNVMADYTDQEVQSVKNWALLSIYAPLKQLIDNLTLSTNDQFSLTQLEIEELEKMVKNLMKEKADIVQVELDIQAAENRCYKVIHSEVMKLRHIIHDEVVKLNEDLEKAINDMISYSNNNLIIAKKYADSLLVVAKAYADQIQTDLIQLISEAERRSKKYTDYKVDLEKIEREIAVSIINKKIDNLPLDPQTFVYNIPRGYKTSIQQAITDIYVGLRPFALTNKKLTEKSISYGDIDKLGLTWFEWDVYNGFIAKHWDDRVFSPVSGKRMKLYDCLCELTNILRWNGKTMDWWDKHTVLPKEAEEDGVNIYDFTFTRNILTSDIKEKINTLLTLSQTLWINNDDQASDVEIQLPQDEELHDLTIIYSGLEGGICEKRIHVDKGTGLYVLSGTKIVESSPTTTFSLKTYENYFSYDVTTNKITFNGSQCLTQEPDGSWSYEPVHDMFVPLKVMINKQHDSIISMNSGYVDTDSI